MTYTSSSPGIGGKICKNCKQPPSETVVFGRHKYTTEKGDFSYEKAMCKACEAALAKAYREKNSDRVSENKKRYREKHRGTIKYHVQEKIATWRKASCVPSDLTVDYLIDLYEQQGGRCYHTGDEMVFGWVDGKVSDNSLSLDKLDPDKGYIQGNVAWCTYLSNTMKQNMTDKEFCAYMDNILQNKHMYKASFAFKSANGDKLMWQDFADYDAALAVTSNLEDCHRASGYVITQPTKVIEIQYVFSAFMGIGLPGPDDTVKLDWPYDKPPDAVIWMREHKQTFSHFKDAMAYGRSFVNKYSPNAATIYDTDGRQRWVF